MILISTKLNFLKNEKDSSRENEEIDEGECRNVKKSCELQRMHDFLPFSRGNYKKKKNYCSASLAGFQKPWNTRKQLRYIFKNKYFASCIRELL